MLANTAALLPPPAAWDGRGLNWLKRGDNCHRRPCHGGAGFRRHFKKPASDIETARQALLATSPDGYIACVAAIRDMDLRVELGSIRSRTLVIAGHLDPATPPAMGRTIAEAIDGARFIELLASHLSNIEAPEAFNAAVLDFLLS